MKLIKPSIEFLWQSPISSEQTIFSEFESLYHKAFSYHIICNQDVTHKIVKYKIFSVAQESTHFCDYKDSVSFIIPPWLPDVACCDYVLKEHPELGEIIENASDAWIYAMQYAETRYKCLLNAGWTPQQARGVLPLDVKTEIVITGNLKEWIHFFELGRDTKIHPQIQEITTLILTDIQQRYPQFELIYNKFNSGS